MSIQGGGGDGMISYADHDVHHVLHEVRGIGGENNPAFEDIQQFEITERGLDPDELAELRAARVAVGVVFTADQPTDSVGSARFEMGAGFNLNGEEYLQAGANGLQVDVDGDGDDDYQIFTKDTDEVGQFWTYVDTLSAPYDDDANGNGGGGLATQEVEMLNMADLFGSGPFVDSADDFTSRIRVVEQNSIATLGVRILYSLYYSVEQTEGGRSRFGR